MTPSEFEDRFEDDDDTLEENQADLHEAVLETQLSAIMVKDPIVVEADATVADAVQLMRERHTGCVLVRHLGRLAGIFTERDILRHVVLHDGGRDWPVASVMTHSPETLPATATIAFALNLMSVEGYRHIPIVDAAGRAIGIVSVKDIINFVVDFFPASVFNLPPDPDHAYGLTTDGG